MYSTLNILPDEINREILYDLNVRSVVNMCKTQKRIANICNKYFWEEYVKRNYDLEKIFPGQNLTWDSIAFAEFVTFLKLTDFIKNWKDIASYLDGDFVSVRLNVFIKRERRFDLTHVTFDDTIKSVMEKINSRLDKIAPEIPRPVSVKLFCEVDDLFDGNGKRINFLFETHVKIVSLPNEVNLFGYESNFNTNIGVTVPFHELMLNGHEVFRTMKKFEIGSDDHNELYYGRLKRSF
jgi:hypothetical protein